MSHRPTLKQTNKSFKSSHRTKGALKRSSARSVAGSSMSRRSVRSASVITAADYKRNRKNASRIAQRNKKAATMYKKRFGTRNGPPKVVVLMPLSPEPGVGTVSVLRSLLEPSVQGADALLESAPAILGGPVTAVYEKLKTRITYVVAPMDNTLEMLEALKCADVVVPIVDALVGVVDEAQLALSMMLSQGMPMPLPLLRNLADVPGPHKNKSKTRKAFNRFISSKLGSGVTFHTLDSDMDVARFTQLLSTTKTRSMSWRDSRPYLFVRSAVYDEPSQRVRLGGYLRGAGLSPNQLLSIPGKGTFEIAALYEAPDPAPMTRAHTKMAREPTDQDGLALIATRSDEHGHSMVQMLPPEEADDEFEDLASRMADFDDDFDVSESAGPRGPVDLSRRPVDLSSPSRARPKQQKGLDTGNVVRSQIQSDWSNYLGLSDDDEATGTAGSGGAAAAAAASDDDLDDGDYANEASDGEEDDAIQALIDRQAEDFEWPDEFAAPRFPLCKDLFREYRGLESFASSPWDPYENLPVEYSQIYEFDAFKRVENEVMNEIDDDGVGLDEYVVVELTGVPASFMASLTPTGVVIGFGLYRYERQFSVVHMSVSRHASFEDPLPSGAPLLVSTGFRTVLVNPFFSAENPKSGKNKFERFLHDGRTSTASILGPIVFGSAPVLMFQIQGDGTPRLVGTGSVLSVDPQKLLIKRIVLTGEPFKTRKHKATVRRMFYSPEDVRYFKPVELWTKYGNRGHILEPLGTHGLMKCGFTNILDQRDTICLSLYTRVFPLNTTVVLDTEVEVEAQDTVPEPSSGLAAI